MTCERSMTRMPSSGLDMVDLPGQSALAPESLEISAHFAFSLFNPVMFQYKGAVVAGQMGMTLAMVYGLQSLGVAILQNSSMAVLVEEFRASCQQTATLPERGLLAIRGRNWLLPEASSFTRIRPLQVAPLLSEKRTKMSVSAEPPGERLGPGVGWPRRDLTTTSPKGRRLG